jgi:hypothetical protein
MTGETDLGVLLASMAPVRQPGEWVFVTVPSAPPDVAPVVTVVEDEGLTMVIAREDADRLGLAYDYVAGRITLRVHSALAAVGLTAAVAGALAEVGISANVVAGFHHDHLFVPADRVGEAVEVLERRSATARARLPHD